MTDSSTRNTSNKAPDGDRSLGEEEALAELRNLLFTHQPAQNQLDSNEEVLAELRNLLFTHQPVQTPQPPTAFVQPSQKEPTTEEEAIAELRSLLFGADLQARLDNPKVLVEDVSAVLPEAIVLRTMQDEQLSKAAVPTVEQAIHTSVKQDLNILSDALFPVMGPAIRKAVSTALKTLTESLNQTLDRSLSPQSFKWRLEAAQTGKSFAEVVILRTLVYRVEQVFLIHKQTSLVLQYVVAPMVAAQDADLVSAMLRAIQDFVQDSFKVSQEDALDTLEFGELTIWIFQGPQALLAGVIRGNAPQELKSVFQTTIEKIHKEFRRDIISFQGDSTPFEPSKRYLEDCLQFQFQAKEDKPSPILLTLLGVIFCSLGLWGFLSFQERQRWANYLEKLNSQPGIVVVNAEKRHGKYLVSGLRDPLAIDPTLFIQEAKLNPKSVSSRWQPYISLDTKFTTIRAKRLLQPPATVSLKVDDNGVLYIIGSAPHQWIEQAKKQATNFPGITAIQTENLIETERLELQSSKEKIEKQILYFDKGNTQLLATENGKLQAVIQEIKKLATIAPFFHKDVRIQIFGHSDNDGSAENNLRLSQARANTILSALVSQGIKGSNLTAVGVGIREPWHKKSTQNNREINRRVSFKVFLTDAPKGKSKQ
ncbi:MAG TPA: flagellar motor protein MotB [Cyanobacteria bacterium UBA11049]|nr:flagellar motor protein MotB [Cyanobacteria bacterium UBA11049]